MYYEKIAKISEIYDRLQDEESKRVFEARVDLTLGESNRDIFWSEISLGKEWIIPSLTDESYVLFGAGIMGKHLKNVIEKSGKKVVAFIDSNIGLHGNKIGGVDILPIKRYLKEYDDKKVIITSRIYEKEMAKQLIELGVKPEMIIYEEDVCAFCGVQYFDVFSPRNGEVFIDAGAFDMDTSKRFTVWNKDYSKIYAFEPDTRNYIKCKTTITDERIGNVQLINKGTYDFVGTLNFSNTGDGGSCIINESSESLINVVTIDSILEGENDKLLYIKMDVEGSEIASIRGAKRTIIEKKPRLAICLYHNNMDIFDIPLYLLELNPDYKFWIRHYASNYCETVLYAE